MKRRYKILNSLFAIVGIAIVALAITTSYTSDCEPVASSSTAADSMQAIVRRCYGGPESLELATVDMPKPGPNEVLVEVKAAAVNPLDYHFMRGSPYLMRLMIGIGAPDDPRLGVDFAGVVAAVGSDVTRFTAGDAVFGGGDGAFAEYLLMPENGPLAIKPDSIEFDQAAAIPIAAITALQALRDHGELKAGQKVLINGASGGVGTYTVQIARELGAEVHGVCSTRNVEMVRGLGADHVFDYKNEDYTKSGNEYDLIVDMVGNHSLSANVDLLKADGRLVMVGGPKGNWIAPFRKSIASMFLSPFVDQHIGSMLAIMNGEDLAYLAELMAAGKLTSRIDTHYPLAETAEALRYLETKRARGKVIITMD